MTFSIDEGPVKAVKPSTLETREYQLRTFASVLVRQGVDAGTLTALSDCLTPEHFKLGLKFFLDRRGGKSSSTVHSLAGMLTWLLGTGSSSVQQNSM